MTTTERISFVISELNSTEQGQHTKFCIFKIFKSFIMSLAILLLSLPHFVLEDYVVSDYHTLSNETKSSIASTRRSTNQSLWVIYLVIMIFISSAGCMPLYTTGTRAEIGKESIDSKQLNHFPWFCFESWIKNRPFSRLWFESKNRESTFLTCCFESVNQESTFFRPFFESRIDFFSLWFE